jgi:hypothetical protein
MLLAATRLIDKTVSWRDRLEKPNRPKHGDEGPNGRDLELVIDHAAPPEVEITA